MMTQKNDVSRETLAKEGNGLKQIAEDSRGNFLYVEPNEVGGHRYWSDEIGSGVCVWDTSLVSVEMMNLALKKELERSMIEREKQEHDWK